MVPPNDEFRRRVDQLANARYLKVFEGMAMAMCSPFWWSSKAGDEPARVVENGTVCFINTGTEHIGVTADHVYQGYLNSDRRSPSRTI
jgi:hypothetical protein